MNNQLPKTLPSFIWHFVKPYKFVAGVFVSLAVFAGFWGPCNSLIIKHILNLLPQVQGGNTSLLIFPGIALVVNFIIFDNITWRSIGYIGYKYRPIIKNKVISETLYHVFSSSQSFFQDNLSGRISNQITTLADAIELILHTIAADCIRSGALLVVACTAAYSVHPVFFYTLLVWFIVFFSFSLAMSRHLLHLASNHAASESLLSGQLVDSISNHNNVRVFATKQFEVSRMHQFFLKCQKTFRAKEGFATIMYGVQGFMIAVMMSVVIYFLVQLYSTGEVTVGDFALILGVSMELGHLMWFTMSRVDELNQAIGKCNQSLNALMVNPEIIDKKNAHELIIQKGQITFDKVKFQYKTARALFQNKSITIEGGQKVGLVGYSGSGKTTFVNLILRLYDINAGNILIDNQDIRDVTQNSLHRAIALIPQDPTLFHRTLMDNIRYGNPGATDEEVVEAARQAHAHEFITALPEGYKSLVGERGLKLSGGQRQRIAIARALLKNAPILVLDEATSQLDAITEDDIQESLALLMQHKTVIVITHRLSTLSHMDRILVFDKGTIVEDGTRTELLARDGLYKTLWDSQMCGFLPDKKIIPQL